MGATRGKDFKLYRNSETPYDNTPTWAEVKNVKDLKRNLDKAMADASTRASTFRQQMGTLKELTLDFNMVYDPDDGAYIQFENCYFLDNDVELLILDGSIQTVGKRGIRFMAQVGKFGTDEALEAIGLTDVSIVPAYSQDNPPRRVEVESPGAVVDSD